MVLKYRPQPQERPPIALAGSLRPDLQQTGDLTIGQLLSMTHQQNLAVRIRQLGDGLADTVSKLAGGQLLAGRRPAGQKRLGQQQRRGIGLGHLAVHRAPSSPQVGTLQLQQTFIGGLANPQVERHRVAPEEFVHPPRYLQLYLLDHVGCIEPGSHARVEARLDESIDSRPITLQQTVQGLPITPRNVLQEIASLG